MSKSSIVLPLDRATVREIKRVIAMAGGVSLDSRVPVETTQAFAAICLRRGITATLEIYKRAELQTSAEARAAVLGASALDSGHSESEIARLIRERDRRIRSATKAKSPRTLPTRLRRGRN